MCTQSNFCEYNKWGGECYLSDENSYGYCFSRCIVAAITITFQFVLFFSAGDNPIPYLLSNFSIIGGYILDLAILVKKYITIAHLVVIELWIESLALVLALADVLYISVYNVKSGYGDYIECISYLIVPLYTLFSLFMYFLFNVIVTINCRKDLNAFIVNN